MRWRAGCAMLTAVLALGGCTTWVKAGATPQMRDAAVARCRAIGYAHVPAAMMTTMTSPGGYTPGKTRCTTDKNGKTRCTPSAGTWTAPTYSTDDANSDARDAMVDDCMYRQGWQKQSAM